MKNSLYDERGWDTTQLDDEIHYAVWYTMISIGREHRLYRDGL